MGAASHNLYGRALRVVRLRESLAYTLGRSQYKLIVVMPAEAFDKDEDDDTDNLVCHRTSYLSNAFLRHAPRIINSQRRFEMLQASQSLLLI